VICLRCFKCLIALVLEDVDLPYCTRKVEHIVAFTAIFTNICTAHAQKLIRLLTEGRVLFSHITFIYLHRRATKAAEWIDKSGLWIPNMWVKFTPYAQVMWNGECAVAKTQCLWYPIKTLWLITQERLGVGSSKLVAGLDTWRAMCDNSSRLYGQRSRSLGHAQEIYAITGFSIGDARE